MRFVLTKQVFTEYKYDFDKEIALFGMTIRCVAGTQNVYSTNNLKEYDADGNATQIQTSTGTWSVEYNGANRPVRWTNAATGTVITMAYDSQGRRVEYKSVTNGTQNTWLRFLYDGYLCIQVLYSNSPYNVFKEFVWDPTEPVATRPLVFRYAPNSLNLFYAFDGNKNVSDVFYRLTSNGIGAHYDYAPFGATTRTHRNSTASFDIVSLNPFRFSSEYYDSELDLIYYNYRHYSPGLGRFLSRDPIAEQGGLNLYAFVKNNPIFLTDSKGEAVPAVAAGCYAGIGVYAFYAAAGILGISLCECLLNEMCRKTAARIACESACEVAYRSKCALCDLRYPIDETKNKFCKKNAASEYALCIADCW